tara:strand:+ start:590 stop:907 length:318 start_codon:yes stop_codon:yes gene_type:complete
MNFENLKTLLSKEITFKDDKQRYNFYSKVKKDKEWEHFTVQMAYGLLIYDTTYQSNLEKLKEKDIELERLTKENDEYMENELLNEVDIKQLREENKRLLQQLDNT